MDYSFFLDWNKVLNHIINTLDLDKVNNERILTLMENNWANKYLVIDECSVSDDKNNITIVFGDDDGSGGNESDPTSHWWSETLTFDVTEDDYTQFISYKFDQG